MIDEFLVVTDEAFESLRRDFELELCSHMKDQYREQVTYANSVTAIRVTYDRREARLFINLFRLPQNGLPDIWGIEERRSDPLNGLDVDDLISIRNPTSVVEQIHPISEAVSELKNVLIQYSAFLHAHAADVLCGDFSVFTDLAGIVARRIEDAIQQGRPVGPEYNAFLTAFYSLEQ